MNTRSLLIAASATALITLPAMAQTGVTSTGTPAATPSTAAPAAGGPAAAVTPPRAAAHSPGAVEQRIQQLHTQLRISPQEQSQWDAFAQTMRQNADNMRDAIDQRGAQMGTMDAAQNMQSYAQLAQVHAQDMQQMASAFQTLYQGMTPEQRQNADQLFRARDQRVAQHHRAHQQG